MMQEGEEKRAQRIRITERDLAVLKWTGEQYAAGLDQVARLLGAQAGPRAQTPGKLSQGATWTWVMRMRGIDALTYEKPFRALPGVVWLTQQGLEIAGLDFQPLIPKIGTLNHLYWCGQARLYVAARRPEAVWISERYLRSDQAGEVKDKSLKRAPEGPDAHVKTEKGTIAIEVELTAKQATRLASIVRHRAKDYFTTWYFCSQETQPRVETAKAALPPELRDRVQIYPLSQLEQSSQPEQQ